MSINGKKVNEVYQTKDYSKFKFREDNRETNHNHVKKLSNSMKERGWITGSYVVVNSKYEVIDGQHRVKAATIAGVPINYTMERKSDFDTIRTLNCNQKNWLLQDHIHGFVTDGNPHYVKLDNFMKEFPELKITECMMLCKNSYTGVPRGTFESGNFTTKDMKKAKVWGENVMSLKPFFKFFNRGIFVRALVVALNKEGFEFDEFLHKVKLRPNMLVPCGTVDQYLELIETVYNYKRSKKINLRF